jgi:hypothetical protein
VSADSAPAGSDELLDDLRVEHGSGARDPGDGFDEIADVRDAVFEEVADACWCTSERAWQRSHRRARPMIPLRASS